MNPNEDLKSPLNPQLKPGEHEIVNAINLLIKEGYLLGETDTQGITMTGKLVRFYREMTNKQKPQITSVVVLQTSITLKEFKEKAEIPFRITTNKGTAKEFSYNVGQVAIQAEKYFNSKVVGRVDMNLLIEVTKAFYKDETQARPTLTNYFLNGLWEDVLKNYKPKETIKVANQSFTGERRL